MNESSSEYTVVYDYSSNYTMNTSMDMNRSLEQIKVLLSIFKEDILVLDEPAKTIIIAMYCILVTIAGKEDIYIFENKSYIKGELHSKSTG